MRGVTGKSYLWKLTQRLRLVTAVYEEMSDSSLFFVRLAMQLS